MVATTKYLETTPSERLLQAVQPFTRVAVVMHDTPDPDAIATGWAIKDLLQQRSGKPVRLIAGGAIVRAENRHLVKLLEPPLELLDQLPVDPQTAIVLVDCGLEAVNHLSSKSAQTPVAVIDHHEPEHGLEIVLGRGGSDRTLSRSPPLLDVRSDLAASATIAATYLREQSLTPSERLATALVYAIRSETRGAATYHSALDREMLRWLTEQADPSLLAEIESAPLSAQYFSDLALALQNSFIHGDAMFCMLPRAAGPETIGEVADLLIRREEICRVLCAAVCDGNVLLSVRTDRHGGNATHLLRETIRGIGRGGGHEHRAGGKLTHPAQGREGTRQLHQLRERWLRTCNVDQKREVRLLPKDEILRHL